MKYLIADLAHKVGATDVKVEPTRLNPETGLRDHPDISYWLEGKYWWLDGTVRRACAPSHVKVAAKSLKQFLDEAAAELRVGSGTGSEHCLQSDCGAACDRQPADSSGELAVE